MKSNSDANSIHVEQTLEGIDRFRCYVEHAPLGMFIADEQGRYLEVNPAACRITGYDASELVGLSIADMLPPEALAEGLAAFAQVRDSGSAKGEFPFVGKGGRRGWWSVNSAKLTGNCFLGFVTDITARKLAEKELRREQDFRQRLLDSAPVIILLLDLNGRIQYVNRFMEELSGYRLEEVQGRDWFTTFLPERGRDRIRRVFLDAAAGTPTKGNRNPIVMRNGEERLIEWNDECLRDDAGQVVGLLVIGQDVTERSQSEEAQLASERKFRAIFESEPECVKLVDRECRLIDINPSGLTLIDADLAEQVCGQSVLDLLLPQYRDAYREGVAKVFQGDRIRQEYEVISLRGTHRWLEQYAVLLSGSSEHGASPQMLAVTRDITERKRAEAALLRAEQRYRKLFEQSPFSIVIIDPDDTTFVEFNDVASRLLGYTREEFGRLSINDIEAVETPAETQSHIQQLLREGQVSFETEHRTKHGEKRNVIVSANAIELEGKKYIQSIFQDITERKRAESKLRESEELLQIFVENAPAGVAMLDRDLCYIAHSRRWLTDYQLGEQPIIGRSHYEVFPEIPQRWKEIHRRCLNGLSERCQEDAFERSDGSVDYLQWEIQPWWDSSGRVGGLVFFTEMITERVLAERALRESQERLAEAQRIAHLGSWNWDIPSGTITWSDEVFRIFGHVPQAFIPRYEVEFLAAVHPDDRQKVIDAVEASLQTGHHYIVEHRVQHPDQSERIVREEGEVELDELGRPIRMVGTVQDITDRKQTEEQTASLREELAHVARVGAIGELAAGIAHELNQPLAAIANYAFATRVILERSSSTRGDDLAKQCLPLLNNMVDQAVRGGEIIRQLQGLIRKQPSTRTLVAVGLLVREVLGLLSAEINQAEIELSVEIPDGLPPVIVEPIQIQQVLLNLCRNAVDAMRTRPDNRRLAISALHHSNEFVAIHVRDWGPGIPADIRPQLFKPFVTSKPDGLGFGLAISRRIVDSHGGELQFCPEIVPGVQFRFTIPIATKDL